MSRRVGKIKRPIQNTSIPVQRLRILWVGHKGIGAEEAVKIRGVITRVIIVQSQIHVLPLAGKVRWLGPPVTRTAVAIPLTHF